MRTSCPICGWPDDQPFQVVSRLRTSEGLTVYTRCACGSLQVRVIGLTGVRIVARGPAEEARCCTA